MPHRVSFNGEKIIDKKITAIASARSPRLRLPPALRIEQILDAALLEFSERGFQSARMDDIARRCGLSKGGLYAHFKSKDDLFESLLARSLTPPELNSTDLGGPLTAARMAAWIVDRLHESLANPRTITTMRLLMADGARVPQLVKLWRENLIAPHLERLGEVLANSARLAGGKSSIIVREPWLVVAPALYVMLSRLIAGEGADIDHEHFRKVHAQMLRELLEPLVGDDELGKPADVASLSTN